MLVLPTLELQRQKASFFAQFFEVFDKKGNCRVMGRGLGRSITYHEPYVLTSLHFASSSPPIVFACTNEEKFSDRTSCIFPSNYFTSHRCDDLSFKT